MIAYNLNTVDAAKRLAKCCEKYDFEVDAIYGKYVVDAKSIMGLIDLVGHIISIEPHCNENVIKNFTNDIKSTWEENE